MVRMLSLTGFGGGFLMISPKLRTLVLEGFAAVSGDLQKYSPWSYVGAAAGLLILAAISAYRSSDSRC
jgi:hypothetical protein